MLESTRSEYIGECFDGRFDHIQYFAKLEIHCKVDIAFRIGWVLNISYNQLEFVDCVGVRVLLRVNVKMEHVRGGVEIPVEDFRVPWRDRIILVNHNILIGSTVPVFKSRS